MKKTISIIAASIVGLFIIAVIIFTVKLNNMKKVIDAAVIENVDLTKYSDGIYEGSFKYFVIAVDVDVTIKSHTIVDVKIVKQSCGKGYEALDTVDRILRKQAIAVDATTGASGSSRAIMLAVQDALGDG